MSSPTWTPNAMPFPAEYLVSQFYPFVPTYKSRVVGYGGAGCGAGIRRVYPDFPNGCQRCPGTGRTTTCANKYPDFWNGRDYYNPSGTSYYGLYPGTRTNACDAKRGCLDPTAVNYDKFSNTHCQDMCVYKKPKVCITRPPGQPPAPCPCGPLPPGKTAEQAIYDAPRGSRAPHNPRHPGAVQWNQQQH